MRLYDPGYRGSDWIFPANLCYGIAKMPIRSWEPQYTNGENRGGRFENRRGWRR